ncbi:MAG: hypothetical protein JWO69_274 [Thermoleophilia bacterium]|jgi:uncharacterized membrane protein|nr:hypothetical protein [Thermoleophilia bacterium]
MQSYEVALFVHVLAAIVWVGGAATIQVLAIRTIGRDNALEIARFSGDAEVVGMRVFMPASLLVVLAGGWMIYDGPWEMSTMWVGAGMGLYLLSFLTGVGFLGPESGRISKLTSEHGPEHPEVQRRIKRILLVSRVELIWLVAVVALMVFKPA